jgi:hypothetical protein
MLCGCLDNQTAYKASAEYDMRKTVFYLPPPEAGEGKIINSFLGSNPYQHEFQFTMKLFGV